MVTRSFALVVFMAIVAATSQASAPTPVLYSTVQTERVVPNLAAVHETTFWLVARTVTTKNKQKINSDKGCGATAVADNVIATATHCLANSGEAKNVIALDLNPVAILVRVDDGSDNSLVKINAHLRKHTRISTHAPVQGDEVFIFGNPGTLVDMYRRGEIMGFAKPESGESIWILMDMNTGKGDSGSGIMNNYGEVIGTVSEIALADKREIKMPYVTAKVTAFHPFNFTKEQLKAVGLDN